jgi:hypothetical protein
MWHVAQLADLASTAANVAWEHIQSNDALRVLKRR